MTKSLVIVESPTKARTIEKFLGSNYEVLASYGHVRDLPNNAAEIPAAVKKEKWSRIGVNVDADFVPLYIVPNDKEKRVAELKKAVKDADQVYLATDEDREGESISWHLLAVLKPTVPVKRLVFHEITKKAIEESISKARTIDENLVKAQETRRIIDRLYGYSVSPLLWKKMVPRLSAGRVQSVAMRLLVERERDRAKFRPADYWDIKAVFSKLDTTIEGRSFEAELTHVNDKRVAAGKDFDPHTGKLYPKADVIFLGEKEVTSLKTKLESGTPKVFSIEKKPFTQRPSPPFTTSTLQQEASRKLNYGAKRTMGVAQTLYENGFITYMRTDSTNLSEEAIQGARDLITREFGAQYLSEEPRLYKTKVKNAQEAHEAIRPAGSDFAHPDVVRTKLGVEAFKLYEMIWKRMISCQMKDAEGVRLSVIVKVDEASFRAAGKTITFPGFLRAYVEGSDDPEADLAEQEKILPPLDEKESLTTDNLESLKHTTQPPARYTEGSLIKELERLGIGRPSTWATIVDVVLSREYAFKKGTALVPSFLAVAVTGLLENYFSNLVNYEFTAKLEDDLDSISRGEKDNLEKLRAFYFGLGDEKGLKELVSEGEKNIDPRIVCGIALGKDSQERDVEVRIGRYGPFLSNGTDRASLPDNIALDELTAEKAEGLLAEAAKGPQALGNDPETNEPIYLKKGRFGPYLQKGEMVEGGEKPRMASLLPGMTPDQMTLELALQLLSLPKSLGKHPELNDEVMVNNGRFGPYISCGTERRTIPADESPLGVSFDRAIEILKQPKTRGRAGSQPKTLKEVGKHPISELAMVIKSGRYGAYVTDGTINASLTEGQTPETLTVEEAANLIDARAAKIASNPGGSKRGRGAKRGAKAAKPAKPAKDSKAQKAPKADKAPKKPKAA